MAEAHASRKRKLKVIMKRESWPFVTALQKASLLDDTPIRYEYRILTRFGSRKCRYKRFGDWLEAEPFPYRKSYNYGWSSLAASGDGKTIVVLDHSGLEKWYRLTQNNQCESSLPEMPATRYKFEEIKFRSDCNRNTPILKANELIPEGIEIVQDVGSSDTFQMVLLKSRNLLEISKSTFTSEIANCRTVANFSFKESSLADACILPSGIPGIYDSVAAVNDLGEITLQNFGTIDSSNQSSLIGKIKDEKSTCLSIWAGLRPSPSGNNLYATTRKNVQLFDIRSRPRYEGGILSLLSISNNQNSDGYEMIGGITTTPSIQAGNGRTLYMCSNLRIVALDTRMPGRPCTQVMLHPSPSFSKKVAIPSGLASISFSSETGIDPSKLDYVAAWWQHSGTSQSNRPAAIMGCFDRSYEYCPCHIRSAAVRSLSLNLDESCVDSDHSKIDHAPMVVRGMPLRIAGPLSCLDFSNQPTADRLSLPWTGLVMTKLSDAAGISNESPLSILSTNVVGDIFLTEISKSKSDFKCESGSSLNDPSYYWPSISSQHGKIVSESIEQLREDAIKSWWEKECQSSINTSLDSSSNNTLNLSHLKTAKRIYTLKPFVLLDSNSDCKMNNCKLERQFIQDRKEKKLRKNSRLKPKFGPHKKVGRPIKSGKWAKGGKWAKVKEEIPEILPTVIKSCTDLDIIMPENYTGEQGIRSSDRLAENKLETTLRIHRKCYFTKFE